MSDIVERLRSVWPTGAANEAEGAKFMDEAADRIEALERIVWSYVDPSDVRQDDEAFVLEIVRRLSNQAGQPWLRTYDAHMKDKP